jgi:hypothetical protein
VSAVALGRCGCGLTELLQIKRRRDNHPIASYFLTWSQHDFILQFEENNVEFGLLYFCAIYAFIFCKPKLSKIHK